MYSIDNCSLIHRKATASKEVGVSQGFPVHKMNDLGSVVCILLCLVLTCSNVFGMIREPEGSDYAVSQLTTQQKQDMLDQHNHFRSMVKPTAANMEYQVT